MATSSEVDAWFDDYEHPAKDAMLRVREIILEDDRMTETIKWKSPTFMYEGNMASFNPRTKAHDSLMFHTGASIGGDHPLHEVRRSGRCRGRGGGAPCGCRRLVRRSGLSRGPL